MVFAGLVKTLKAALQLIPSSLWRWWMIHRVSAMVVAVSWKPYFLLLMSLFAIFVSLHSVSLFLSLALSHKYTITVVSLEITTSRWGCMSDPHSIHHLVSTPTICGREKPTPPHPTPLLTRLLLIIHVECLAFSKTISHHVLSSRMSHPAVLHVIDDCLNNAALSGFSLSFIHVVPHHVCMLAETVQPELTFVKYFPP